MKLSLLIPTYNENDIIESTLTSIATALEPELAAQTEVIIVDDGSDALPKTISRITPKLPFAATRIIRNSPPAGKGKSLAMGVSAAKSPICGFIDADLSTPLSFVSLAFANLAGDQADIVIASRYSPGATVKRKQFWLKTLLGDTLRLFTQLFLFGYRRRYKDTQCGCKFFKTPIARLVFSNLVANDGMADIEVLMRANLLKLRVQEIGVNWSDTRESKRSLSRILLNDLRSLLSIAIEYKLFAHRQASRLSELERKLNG